MKENNKVLIHQIFVMYNRGMNFKYLNLRNNVSSGMRGHKLNAMVILRKTEPVCVCVCVCRWAWVGQVGWGGLHIVEHRYAEL